MRWAIVVIALGIVSAATPSQGQPGCCACLRTERSSPALFCVFLPDGASTTPLEQRCEDQGGSELLCLALADAMTGVASDAVIGEGSCRTALAGEVDCPNVPLGAPVLNHTWLAAPAVLLAGFATVRLARRRRWSS